MNDTLTSKDWEVYFNSEVAPLKNEWIELYELLKNGHLLYCRNSNEYFYSAELYRLIRNELPRVYSTSFLNEYNMFVLAFGKPNKIQERYGQKTVTYSVYIPEGALPDRGFDLLSYQFDMNSDTLIDITKFLDPK